MVLPDAFDRHGNYLVAKQRSHVRFSQQTSEQPKWNLSILVARHATRLHTVEWIKHGYGDIEYGFLPRKLQHDQASLWKTCVLISPSDWNAAESRTIFAPAPGLNYSTDIWAPELHNLSGSWYIIFTADPRNDAPPPEVDM